MGLVVKKSKFFKRTAKKHLQKNRKLYDSYKKFEKIKSVNPDQAFGSSNQTSPPGTLYAKKFPKMYHAHLIGNDHSVWYEIVGNELRLYAILTHNESGTNPTKIPIQRSVSQRFSNQTFEQKVWTNIKEDINGSTYRQSV